LRLGFDLVGLPFVKRNAFASVYTVIIWCGSS